MDVYLDEYTSDDAIRKYTSETAGFGISYLLEHDYAEVYLTAIDRYLNPQDSNSLRLLEFGCGGGMNIITLLSLLERTGRHVEMVIGTDFSPSLIGAAARESERFLSDQ